MWKTLIFPPGGVCYEKMNSEYSGRRSHHHPVRILRAAQPNRRSAPTDPKEGMLTMADNQEIKKFIAAELAAGRTLSEIQSEVNTKFSCKMTFMELRILAAELENVDWAAMDPAPPKESDQKTAADTPDAAPASAAPGKTTVEVSKVLRPGAVAGGSVRFGSGASAEWYVDQFGRLGLDKVSGEPTETDLQEFQKELQTLFAR